MSKILSSLLVAAAMLATAGCGGGHEIVPLLRTSGLPMTLTPKDEVPLEVVTRSTAVRDPLPVSGSDIAYVDLEAALGIAVSTGAAPYAQKLRDKKPGGFQLTVEILQADAQFSGGRLMLVMNVNATLRTRTGSVYLAQTQSRCREAGLVDADRGGPVVYACMTHIGRQLGGWMSGLPM